MKHLFLLCLSVLLLASCSSGRYPSALYVADSLSVACPERAVALLDSLRPQMEQEGERVRMYYQLLCVKARDKAYLPHTSDSLVLEVLRYYEDKQDRLHLPEAYYYAGRVASDLGDAPQALDYFQQALDAMPEGEMTDLRSRTISQMGTLFSAQGLYKEALKMRQESFRCDSLLNDSIGLAFSLRDIGLSYHDLEEHELELPYYLRAYQISTAIRQANLIHSIQCCLAKVYSEQGQYEEALRYVRKALAGIGGPGRNAICLTAGFIYHALGMKDSAAWYYQEILRLNYPQTQRIAYGNLGQLAVERGDPAAALALFRKYVNLTDSLSLVSDSESIRRMNALYNYQLRERENASLQKAYASQTRNLLFVSCCLVVALSAFLVYRQYQWRNRKILAARLDRLTRQKEQAEADSRLNRQEIHGLETELAQERQKSREAAAEYQKQLQDMRQSTDASCRLRKEQRTQIQNTDIYRLLEEKASSVQGKANVTAKEWQELERVIRTFDADFLPKLEGLPYSWKSSERLLCLLLRVGFTPSQIGVLLGRPVQTITTMRRRLAERLLDNLKTPKGWDDFICSL